MKTRNGFVSNSSSSSFVINLEDISAKQLKLIQSHQIEGKKLDIPWADTDFWDVTVTETTVEGSTFMDNFSMSDFLDEIGVYPKVVQWD